MTDRFEEIRTFVEVVRSHGIGAAAKQLKIAKSAVSRRINELESRVGCQLIQRTTRKQSLTEAGQLLFEKGRLLLDNVADIEDSLGKSTKALQGTLRISAPTSFTIGCICPHLNEFSLQNPGLTIDIDLNDKMVDIIDGGYDLALRIGQLQDSQLIARKLCVIRHAFCASPRYLELNGVPKTPRDLSRHTGLYYTNVSPKSYWMLRDGSHADVKSRLLFNSGDAIKEAALHDSGIAYLPTFITFRAFEQGSLKVLLKGYEKPPIHLHAVYSSRRHLPAKARSFIEFLQGRIGSNPAWDRYTG